MIMHVNSSFLYALSEERCSDLEVSSGLYCCGVNELHDLHGSDEPERILASIIFFREDFSTRPAFYVFTDTAPSSNGKKLATFIRKKRLGALTQTRPHLNNNSGNKVIVWVWAFNENRAIKVLDKFLKSAKVKGK